MPRKELHFSIEESSPYALSMARLTDYLRELAKLFANEEKIHFLRVDEGSADCLMEVEEEVEPLINARVARAAKGLGPAQAITAYKNLRSFLEHDEKSAYMEWKDGDVILHFPKKAGVGAETFGPFWQEGTLDGILVKIGGLDNTVPVHLIYEGTHRTCNTTREVAKGLGHHLYGHPIRVHGRGKWYRNADGKWELRWFDIYRFEELSEDGLLDAVARLRAIPDNDLVKSKNPLRDMHRIRYGKD
jgi:hypothetical protein